jgi:hypothetical protein
MIKNKTYPVEVYHKSGAKRLIDLRLSMHKKPIGFQMDNSENLSVQAATSYDPNQKPTEKNYRGSQEPSIPCILGLVVGNSWEAPDLKIGLKLEKLIREGPDFSSLYFTPSADRNRFLQMIDYRY